MTDSVKTNMHSVFSANETTKINLIKFKIKNTIEQLGVFNFMAVSRMNGVRKLSNNLLSEDVRSKMVVAGGFIKSQIRNEKHNDVDVFILSPEGENNRYILDILIDNKPGTWTIRFSGEDDYFYNEKIIMTAKNSITNIQYILTKYETRQDLITHFDYVHCMASYVYGDDSKLFITKETYDAINNKHLIPNPKANIKPYRTKKFLDAGWKTPEDIIHEEVKSGVAYTVDQIYNKHVLNQTPPTKKDESTFVVKKAYSFLPALNSYVADDLDEVVKELLTNR